MSGVQESLSVSDPLYNVPWQNFVQNSAIILGITFSVPVGVSLVMHSFRQHSKFDPEMFSFVQTAPVAFFATLLVGLFLDRFNTRVQKFFRESSGLLDGRRTAKKEENDPLMGQTQPPTPEGRGSTSQWMWSSLPMKLLVFAFLPFITWSSPMLWFDAVAEAYVGCSFACHATPHINKHKNFTFCGNNITQFSDMVENRKAHHWPKRLESSFGTTSPKVVLEKCQNIFDSKRTRWAEQMHHQHMYFLAFEAVLRQHHKISSVEVFGSSLGGVIIVLWLVIKAALAIKTKELVTYRNTFLRQNMMVQPSTIEKYAKLFLHLNSLQKGVAEAATQEYSVKILKTAMEGTISMKKQDNVEEAVAKAFKNNEDADGDGTDDSVQTAWIDMAVLWRELACGFLALVHVSVPAVVKLFLKRQKSLVHRKFTTFLSEELQEAFVSREPRAQPAIIFNLIVGFVAYYFLFKGLAVAYERYRLKFDQLLAFRCMWRFPDENPLDDVNAGVEKMSDSKIIEKIPTLETCEQQDVEKNEGTYILKHSEDRDKHLLSAGDAAQGSWAKLQTRLYRFDFSHRLFRKLFDEVPRLSEWYNMRRYIQIDCVDERIATEMFSTLAVVCLLWKLVMVLINWVSMNSGSGRKLQVVNFESLYDAAAIAILLMLSLTLTLQFNDEFARHHVQVNSLQEHLKLVHAGDCIKRAKKMQLADEEAKEMQHAAADQAQTTKSGENKGKSQAEEQAERAAGRAEADKAELERFELQAAEAEKYIQTISDGVQKFDRPATIFGLSVNRELIGGIGSFVAISAAPVALKMLQSIVLGESDEE